MIRVLIAGAAGKMGRTVVDAVDAQPDMAVAALVDPAAVNITLGRSEHIVEGDLNEAIRREQPDVMVDFTHPSAVEANVRLALSSGIDCVVGTTGLDHTTLRGLADAAPEGTALFFAPNYAIGAVLLMRFAEQAARHMPHVEIIELHHDGKADSPSGTAISTAHIVSQSRHETPSSPGRETESHKGARGALIGGIPVHSVRLPGLVAHQEILFGGEGQTLTLRHDSIDRTSFMPGVVLAIRSVQSLSGLVVGLETLMDD